MIGRAGETAEQRHKPVAGRLRRYLRGVLARPSRTNGSLREPLRASDLLVRAPEGDGIALPRDLGAPLSLFDPAAVPAVRREPARLLPPLRRTPAG